MAQATNIERSQVTFGAMIKIRLKLAQMTNEARKKYLAEVKLTIQALVLTSFVFVYNIDLLLYTNECCPWFVAPSIVVMLWAAHYSGPMLALSMSSVLRRKVRNLLGISDNTVLSFVVSFLRSSNRIGVADGAADGTTIGGAGIDGVPTGAGIDGVDCAPDQLPGSLAPIQPNG